MIHALLYEPDGNAASRELPVDRLPPRWFLPVSDDVIDIIAWQFARAAEAHGLGLQPSPEMRFKAYRLRGVIDGVAIYDREPETSNERER